ncbi:MAG: ATPase, T2SS/T4P/T4SS family [bacterium]
MRISPESLKKILAKSGKVTLDVLKEAETIASQTGESLDKVLVQRHMIGERELVSQYAASLNLPYVALTGVKVPREMLSKIPERIALQYQVVLFGNKAGKWQLAMTDPEDIQAIDVIDKQLGGNLQIYVATPGDVLSLLDQYRTGLDNEISQAIKDSSKSEKSAAITVDSQSIDDLSNDAPIAKTVNIILEYALKARASDIHIEPREKIVQIRYRIDGVLKESMTLPKQIVPAVVSRIKIMANLKIDEHRLPQDGRFKSTIGSKTIAVRVSTLPVMEGEKVVMRLLDETNKAKTLDELGFAGQGLTSIQNAMKQPHGMILVTGPTGAGKSTTLYSVLTQMNTPGVNISTIEDPVEYRIPGVNQTQVNVQAGMTFSNGLRSLLRQDPNIIMVGEIRDTETANLAIQAALTGHTVLSTLHTNNAATTLPRLLDMDIEPFLISTTINTVIAQRLVRQLCPQCRRSYQPSGDVLEEIRDSFHLNDLPKVGSQPLPTQSESSLAAAQIHTPNPDPPYNQPLENQTNSTDSQPNEASSQATQPSTQTPADQHGQPAHSPAPHRVNRNSGESRKVIPVPADLETTRRSILDKIAADPTLINRPSGQPNLDMINEMVVSPSTNSAINPTTPPPQTIAESIPAPSATGQSMTLYQAVGCAQCEMTGYKGRIGIYEVLDITPEIARLITTKGTANEIQKQAIKQGMITMQEDGFAKALQGLTTIEEVMRVTRE